MENGACKINKINEGYKTTRHEDEIEGKKHRQTYNENKASMYPRSIQVLH